RDVERYLRQEPVEACPPSVAYRFQKFARRNRVALTTAGAIVALLISTTVVSAWQAARAKHAEAVAEQRLGRETLALAAESRARSDAEEAIELAERQASLNRARRDLTLRSLYVAQIALAHQDWKAGNLSRMRSMLDTRSEERRV